LLGLEIRKRTTRLLVFIALLVVSVTGMENLLALGLCEPKNKH
jgi:hypothetical protein